MALIKCPECGKEVSDRAETCIHCGYPLKEDLEEQEEKNEEEEIDIDEEEEVDTISAAQFSTKQWTPIKEEKKKRRGRTAIIIVVVIVVIIVLIAVWYYRSNSYTRATRATEKAEQEYRDAQSNLDSLERQKSEVEAEIDTIESNR